MRIRVRRCLPIALGAALVASFAGAAAAGAAVSLETIGSYSAPVYVTSDPTDENRIFIVEQDGRIQLTAGGATSQFLDLDSIVLSAGEPGGGNEQGLLSMAFAPDFHTSGRFYVFYTGTDGGSLHVGELTASGDFADPATLRDVITIPHPGAQNHNGGQLQLGPDGHLYASTGDGGTGGGPAQNPNNLLGKILRIDPTAGGGHTVPADNPLGNEVWSEGLRNPWRFSFDRATGDLLIADVGQATWEEVDFSPAPVAGRGLNFGWPCREGPAAGPGGCSGAFTDPVFWYQNDASTCAITGGYVVRDPGLTELQGRYVYADLCGGVVRSFDPVDPFGTDRSEGLPVTQPTSFGQDACGRVYVASRTGPVSRLVDDSPTECPVIDGTGPGLALHGKHRQNIERRRRVSVELTADESGFATVGAVVTAGKHGHDLFELAAETTPVDAGAGQKLRFALARKQARRCRRLIGNGKRVEVRFAGSAIDAAGNSGPEAELEVRLKAG
jgi:glucose/sorbosone dehydrogenase